MLTVGYVHSPADPSCEAIYEPAVHGAKHGIIALNGSSNLHDSRHSTPQLTGAAELSDTPTITPSCQNRTPTGSVHVHVVTVEAAGALHVANMRVEASAPAKLST